MTDLRSRFGLNSIPFTREMPIDKRFDLEIFTDALNALERTVDQRMSAALIGPAGTGKTVVLRALCDKLPEARYRVHYLKVTDLSKKDMCREIATALGADAAGNYPALVRKLQEHFLANLDIDSIRPILLIDDAHDMRPEVLGMIRLITNFEMDSRLVVSVILSGQPPLRRLLERDNLVDVARRLAHCAHLRVLSREETVSYVEHRINIAGASTNPFDSRALDALYEIGRGNLRATSLLALKSLQLAHDANAPVVDSSHVVEARKMLP